MTDLSTRIEQAGEGEQREMLEAAWEHLCGRSADFHTFAQSVARGERLNQAGRFGAMIYAGAYESAALLLVPNGEGHWPQVIQTGINPNNPIAKRCRAEIWAKGSGKPYRGAAATPALALACAAIRARGL